MVGYVITTREKFVTTQQFWRRYVAAEPVPASGGAALDGRVERLHVAGAVGVAAVGAAAGVERRVARVLDRGVLVHCARPGPAWLVSALLARVLQTAT